MKIPKNVSSGGVHEDPHQPMAYYASTRCSEAGHSLVVVYDAYSKTYDITGECLQRVVIKFATFLTTPHFFARKKT